VFPLAFSAGGLLLLVLGLRSRRKAEASKTWPTTSGRIVRAEVRRVQYTDYDDGDSSTYWRYYPLVEYEYRVGDQTYIGHRTAFTEKAFTSEAGAQRQIARFPVGSEVMVYYNPEKPEEAVLERSAYGTSWFVAIGAVLLAVGFCSGCVLAVALVKSLVG
jgi:hypothetical protein